MTDKATGIVAATLKFIFSFFSFLYLCGINIISILRQPAEKLAVRVISIGNLTLGGTGKTPLVEFVAGQLLSKGFKVAVLTRGYKISQEEPDEPSLLRKNLPQVQVMVGPDRVKSGRVAIEKYGVNAIILDDGFQYRRLKRDLDILMIDATNPFGNEKLIPRGVLREPVKNLKRADVVVLSKTDMATENQLAYVKNRIKSLKPDILIASSVHRPVPLEGIKAKQCIAVVGIADPGYFLYTLKALGIASKANFIFPDHYPYNSKDLNAIYKKCRELSISDVITTEKDMIRLRPLIKDAEIRFLALAVKIELTQNKDRFIECLTRYYT
jgi:tetraacyldisaccharide 4'-kinase